MTILPSQSAFCIPLTPIRRPRTVQNRPQWICCVDPNKHPPKISRRTALLTLGTLGLHLINTNDFRPPPVRADEEEGQTPLTGFQTRSGLKYFDFRRGEGPTPEWGDFINLQYVAYTITPAGDALVKQDSSYDWGDDGYLIHHGNGEQILGLEEAVHTMKTGGRRRCIIPAGLAYIDGDLGPVPIQDWKRRKFSKALIEGDGTVVFDIELVSFWKDPDDRGYYSDLTPDEDEMMKLVNPEGREDVVITFDKDNKS